jgi:1-acyl-sn-glycerol-3-phosphate acyltransferase
VKTRSKLSSFLHALRSFLFFNPLIYFYTVVLGTLSLLSSFVDRGGRIQHSFASTWSRLILKTIFSPVTIVGLENIDKSHPAVYAVNHQSALDIPMLYGHLPMQFRIIAKVELFRYPFMGWHLTRSGQIAVDEKNVRTNLRSLNRGVETIKSGMPLVVFPEGARTADGEIKKFLSGAFYIAVKAGVPVIPVAIVGTYEVLQMNHYVIHPGPMQMIIGKPISTAAYTTRDLDALSEKVKAAIEDMYYVRAGTKDPRVKTTGTEYIAPQGQA